MLPNSCVTLQFLHNIPGFGKITSRIEKISNYKLFREDFVFLYPSPMYRTYLKLQQKFNGSLNVTLSNTYDHLKLSYYQGQLLSISQAHGTKNSNQWPFQLSPIRTNKYHILVVYPRAIAPMSVNTRAVEFAYGLDVNIRAFATFDFESGPDISRPTWVSASQSWVSSTIYHINCHFDIKIAESTSAWSGISVEQINELCNLTGSIPKAEVEVPVEYLVLKPPIASKTINQTSSLWTLSITFKNHRSQEGSTPVFGHLEFTTSPTSRFCNKTFADMITEFCILKEAPQQSPICPQHKHIILNETCVYLTTTTELDLKLLNRSMAFQLGYQVFQETSLKLFTDSSLKQLRPGRSSNEFLSYFWKRNKYNLKTRLKFHKNIKMLNFSRNVFSWSLAIQQCNKYGMTLPQLKDEKTTMELVFYLLDNNILPTYALYVGLMKKVRKCLPKKYHICFQQW